MNQTPKQGSVLHHLRALVPSRRLTYGESLRVAELQANHLLEHFQIVDDRVPNELISELPRIEVRYAGGLPVSGSTHWEDAHWVITLNADEPSTRRRFSLMHEFKHIVDHTTMQHLYGDIHSDEFAAERAERAADHFAACVLMPKRRVKALWFETGQNLNRAAARLGVSTRALNVRLFYLGLAPDTRRCSTPRTHERPLPRSPHRTYFRRAVLRLELAA